MKVGAQLLLQNEFGKDQDFQTIQNDLRLVGMAEKLGFDSVWIPEAWGYEQFQLLTEIALHTERLKLATGIANVWEVCHHLRGEAGDRQIEGAKVGLAHVIGLGSACGIHILEKSGL